MNAPATATTVEPETILAVRDLTVSFAGADGTEHVAVRDFSLTIGAGEFVGIMGEPGCGKSTAAIAMMGLVRPPGLIAAGSVSYLGQDLLAMSDDELDAIRGRDIGLIVQSPRTSLHPMLTVGRQIENVYRAHNKVGRRAARQRAIEMLRLVGINDPERRVKSYAHELSTGMTQRVLIAMAMSSSPKLLIADEPTSGLDVTIQAQFLDQMWEAANRTGSAVLLVTQDLGIIANYCDRVVIMEHGAIVESRPVRAFFQEPEHDYSRRILALQRESAASISEAAHDERISAEPLVVIEGLTKKFDIRGSKDKVHAADDVSFEVRRGEVVGLVGESGSGKTTVGRCLVRLEELTGGVVTFEEDRVSDLTQRGFTPFRKAMQIVFQDPFDSMNPRWTVEQILTEPLDLHTSLTAEEKRARVTELLEMVGIDPAVRAVRPRQLSAGRQQRIAIARAIATEPAFVVLDEPTSALSPETRAEIIRLLIKLSRELDIAYLFISHDLTTVEHLCDRVVVMYLGQIVEAGTRAQVFQTPAHPYSKALLASHLFPDIADRRVDRAERMTLKGEIPSPVSLPDGCYLYGRCPSQVDRCQAMPQELEKNDDGRMVRCWRVAAGELSLDTRNAGQD
jgi:oligopeptide/dipeptide ABC transporter ATP-binding protein